MVKKVFDYLLSNNKTISFAESCTGGNLSSSISKIPGASKIFIGSIVSYSKFSKKNILKIDEIRTIDIMIPRADIGAVEVLSLIHI